MTNSQSKPCREENTCYKMPQNMRAWLKIQLHLLKEHKLEDWQFESIMELLEGATGSKAKEMNDVIREVENERRLAGLSYTDIDAESDDETE